MQETHIRFYISKREVHLSALERQNPQAEDHAE
jgi:hypothetical protein